MGSSDNIKSNFNNLILVHRKKCQSVKDLGIQTKPVFVDLLILTDAAPNKTKNK